MGWTKALIKFLDKLLHDAMPATPFIPRKVPSNCTISTEQLPLTHAALLTCCLATRCCLFLCALGLVLQHDNQPRQHCWRLHPLDKQLGVPQRTGCVHRGCQCGRQLQRHHICQQHHQLRGQCHHHKPAVLCHQQPQLLTILECCLGSTPCACIWACEISLFKQMT